MIPYEIIELQKSAIEKLIELLPIKNELVFKAPTGSGKTHMMAEFMSDVIKNDHNVIFLVSTLSQSHLDEQNEMEFRNYQFNGEFKNLKIHRFETQDDNNVEKKRYSLPTNYNVYILGDRKYTKGGNLYKYFEGWLKNINFLGKKIYVIRDEGHRETKNLKKQEQYYDKIIDFTATPKPNTVIDVEITNSEAERTHLIKKVRQYDGINEKYSLEDALDKLIETQKIYADCFGEKIRPCMIIQVSNENKVQEELNEIFTTLNKKEYRDLKWVYIVGDDKKCDTNDAIKRKGKFTENDLKKLAEPNNSLVDIVIFKLTLKEGWNVKRACILYQKRDTESQILERQVVGRIRRNPVLTNFDKYRDDADKFMTAYVYGDMATENNSITVELKKEAKDIKNEIKICTVSLAKEDIKTDCSKIISEYSKKVSDLPSKSIFTLFEVYRNSKGDLREAIRNNSTSFSNWIWSLENINDIKKEYNKVAVNYRKNLDFTRDEQGNIKFVSFPDISSYTETNYKNNIGGWIWQRSDDSENETFMFDSEAETDFADKLKQTADDYCWGKNFLPNSEMCFEYYNEKVCKSFPDFILKDKKNRIHIIEVKSLIKSTHQNIDEDEYKQKISALRNGYHWFALLTGYIFYIPIFTKDDVTGKCSWNIIRIMRNPKYEIFDWKKQEEQYGLDELIIDEYIEFSEFKQFIKE